MPSGAKRRKAAKKKKEQPNGAEAVSFTGGESDGAGVSAPASPGQIDVEKDVVEKVEEEEGTIEIVKGMGSEDDYEIRDLGVEGGKSGKDSSDGSSSSSSSNDEKVEVEKSEAVVEEKVAVEETEVVLDSAVQEEVQNAVESASNITGSAVVCEKVVNVTEAAVHEPAQVAKEEVVYVNDAVVAEPENVVKEEAVYATKSAEGEPVLVVEEVGSVTEVAGVEPKQIFKEVVYVTEDPNIPVQPELDFELKDDSLTLTSESHGESSSAESSELKNGEDKALPSSDSPIVKNGNGLGHIKDPEIHDSVNDQLPLSSVPLAVQRTSWKGCCGLFEVFTGSR